MTTKLGGFICGIDKIGTLTVFPCELAYISFKKGKRCYIQVKSATEARESLQHLQEEATAGICSIEGFYHLRSFIEFPVLPTEFSRTVE